MKRVIVQVVAATSVVAAVWVGGSAPWPTCC
jgi:hypothetical protein